MLPDDRDTVAAVREVVTYLDHHRCEPVPAARIATVTGLPSASVVSVFAALLKGFVVSCDGDPRSDPCTYSPDAVLSLEVNRFLRVAGGSAARLQRGVDRFRSSFGTGA